MARQSKYKDPEMRKLHASYCMDSKQQLAREQCITKLGGKCEQCGEGDKDVLEVVRHGNRLSWISTVKDIDKVPQQYDLFCANCNARAKSVTTRTRLSQIANALLIAQGFTT